MVDCCKNQTYKALFKIKEVITRDVPPLFTATVKVDETYLGGQKRNKNKNKKQLKKEEVLYGKSKKGFGTTKQPVFAILSRSGKVFAKVVSDNKAKELIPIIEKKVKKGNKICFDTYSAYTGLATKGYVHGIVNHKNKQYVKGKNHINGLEGFFGYLKKQLAS